MSAGSHARPGFAAIWQALESVADPEIPVLSVVDLGIVRAVKWEMQNPTCLNVQVTPTYSGCPATELIAHGIRAALAGIHVPIARIETALSPPWTTAWLTPQGERKLRAYGIAPPGSDLPSTNKFTPIDVTGLEPLRRAAAQVACTHCGSPRTQLIAQYGSTACKAQYRCLDCREPFEHFKRLE